MVPGAHYDVRRANILGVYLRKKGLKQEASDKVFQCAVHRDTDVSQFFQRRRNSSSAYTRFAPFRCSLNRPQEGYVDLRY